MQFNNKLCRLLYTYIKHTLLWSLSHILHKQERNYLITIFIDCWDCSQNIFNIVKWLLITLTWQGLKLSCSAFQMITDVEMCLLQSRLEDNKNIFSRFIKLVYSSQQYYRHSLLILMFFFVPCNTEKCTVYAFA